VLGIKTRLLGALRQTFPSTIAFAGTGGNVWLAGAVERGPTVAAIFCGSDTGPSGTGRQLRARLPAQAVARAAAGSVAVLYSGNGQPLFPDPAGRAINAPLRIALRKRVPDTVEALLAGLKTSTTQEDLRRIRKAGFTFRITQSRDDIRRFHARFLAPLVARRFPEDGWVMSVEDLLADLERGGELVCADIGGDWVGGLFNWADPPVYSMGPLGIRDAEDAIRHLRVVPALLVASMQRAVALGCIDAMLGFSVPFLGKGPIWFKAKWGCTLEIHPTSPNLQIFLDLRHAAPRRALADSPVLFRDGPDLAACAWLMPGEEALTTLTREASRFSGISRWYVLAEARTIADAERRLAEVSEIVPVNVDLNGNTPLWLGQLIRTGRPTKARAGAF
jgi:hypothetical protein